jgi:hypothetical protein
VATLSNQVVVCTKFNNLAGVDHSDTVCAANSA